MVSNLKFVEGEEYHENEIQEEFIEKQYFQKNKKGTFTLKVCGITSFKKNNYIFYPKGYNLNSTEEKHLNFARKLFQTLKKYKNSVLLSDAEYDWLGYGNDLNDNIELVEWLIDDFKKNGIYTESIENNGINKKGKIDWARTIKNQTPLIKDNKLIYIDVITRNKQINTKHAITLIHQNVVYECIKQFGWLFSIENQFEKIELPFDKNKQNIILEKKLSESYSNRQVKLLKSIIAFVNKSNNEELTFNLVTPYFYSVWEEMLKIVFNHNHKIHSDFPRPYWELPNQSKKETIQIPDILLEDNNRLIIIDAKYYSTFSGEINRFPGWESVVKQLYYNMSVNDQYDDVQNIFIMPESLPIGDSFKYIGKTSVMDKESEFGFVYAFSVDLSDITGAYTTNLYMKDLLNSIVENTKNLKNIDYFRIND